MIELPTIVAGTSVRAVLIWSAFGPYHQARLRALTEKGDINVVGVEAFNESVEYKGIFEVETAMTPTLVQLRVPPDAPRSVLIAALNGALNALRPDVVFTPGWSTAPALVAINWCVENRAACVIMSDSNRFDEPRTSVKELLKRRIVSLVQSAFVAGSSAKEYLIQLGMLHDQVYLGYDAIDNEHFSIRGAAARTEASAVRVRLRLPDRYFLCCARLVEKKNHLRLVEAYAIAAAATDLVFPSLVIVGPGPLEDEIRSRAEALGVAHRVLLMGAMGYEELPQLYSLAEALVLPSIIEQWGLVVNEAMASGIPVLVSIRSGCASDLVEHGANGFVFDPFNVDAIADTLTRFVRLSDTERDAMGRRSREIISFWGLDRFVRGFDAAAQAALAAPSKKPALADRLLLKMLTLR